MLYYFFKIIMKFLKRIYHLLLKLKFKLNSLKSLINNYDIRYVNSFTVNELINPIDHSKFHLNRSLIGLKNMLKDSGGFCNKYDLANNRYGPIYPETTGYTIGTLINLKKLKFNDQYKWLNEAPEKALRSLLTYQLKSGGFTGGRKGMKNFGYPSFFNSGQISLGVMDYFEYKNDFEYEYIVLKLNNFFKTSLKDGFIKKDLCFRGRDSTYYTRALWGASRIFNYSGDIEGIKLVKNVADSFLLRQEQDGSFNKWGFYDDYNVLHTIIYTLRGFWELGNILKNEKYIESSINGMLWLQKKGNRVKVGSRSVAASFPDQRINELCLTGLAQQAILASKMKLHNIKLEYNFHIQHPLEILKSSQFLATINTDLEGTLLGSRPFNGRYQGNCCPQWAMKFFIDILMIDLGLSPNKVNS